MDKDRLIEIIARIFQEEINIPSQSPKTSYQVKSCVLRIPMSGSAPKADCLIVDNPEEYELHSNNYDALKSLFHKTPEGLKDTFFETLQGLLCSSASLLAMAAIIKLGEKERLIKLLEGTDDPIRLPFDLGILSIIFEYEYNRFDESELKRIEKRLTSFRPNIIELADGLNWYIRAPKEVTKERVTLFNNIPHLYWRDGRFYKRLLLQITKAIHKMLTSFLKGEETYDITKDKEQVLSFLVKAGFSLLLAKAIDEINQKIETAATGFDYKDCGGKIRSLLDEFNKELRDKVANKKGMPFTGDKTKHQEAIDFLSSNNIGFYSIKTNEFCSKLYGLISDESGHPLITDAEYARLFRNVVIEYMYLCLSIYSKYS